jgi:hypothetical protein
MQMSASPPDTDTIRMKIWLLCQWSSRSIRTLAHLRDALMVKAVPLETALAHCPVTPRTVPRFEYPQKIRQAVLDAPESLLGSDVSGLQPIN